MSDNLIQDIYPTDIILSGGEGEENQLGNRFMKLFVQSYYKKQHNNDWKNLNMVVTLELSKKIQTILYYMGGGKGGRFLKWKECKQRWYEVNFEDLVCIQVSKKDDSHQIHQQEQNNNKDKNGKVRRKSSTRKPKSKDQSKNKKSKKHSTKNKSKKDSTKDKQMKQSYEQQQRQRQRQRQQHQPQQLVQQQYEITTAVPQTQEDPIVSKDTMQQKNNIPFDQFVSSGFIGDSCVEITTRSKDEVASDRSSNQWKSSLYSEFHVPKKNSSPPPCSLQEEIKLKCLTILDDLETNDTFYLFNNLTFDLFKSFDYNSTTNEPMDFKTIRTLVQIGYYKSIDSFKADVNLTLDNAMCNNKVNSLVYKSAQELQAQFEEIYFLSEELHN